MAGRIGLLALGLVALVATTPSLSIGQFVSKDPGVRAGAAGAGGMLPGLTPGEQSYFHAGVEAFSEVSMLENSLGPRFNLDSCGGCHIQPALGGTSPAVNPQVAIATQFGAKNKVPPFVRSNGPIVEARFKYDKTGERDGSVHALFVISGRKDGTGDATGCVIYQDQFDSEFAAGNVSLRIPSPVFGTGLIEMIPDKAITDQLINDVGRKVTLGIVGRVNKAKAGGEANRSGNDGTVMRFGWKAQNKSLLIFAGEAYNVEQGVTNEMFQTERDETPGCLLVTSPNDTTNTDATTPLEAFSDLELFAFFMKFLDAPKPSTSTPGGAESIARGRSQFITVGCNLCHTPAFTTGQSSVAALSEKPVNLFSDLALHRMGPGLADDIVQGAADGDEFRTAPLWGLGQRIFFLHDGRTRDLKEAIEAHASAGNGKWGPSEANMVIDRYRALPETWKQDLLNFLRSL